MKNLHRSIPAVLTLTAAALLAACASTPLPNVNLTQAHSAYDQAAADPYVARSASKELSQAQQALIQADNAFRAGEDSGTVDHLAYLANQRVAVAVQTGRIAQSDKASSDAAAQRDRLVIESRTAQADAARTSAIRAQNEAAMARQQASVSQDQAAALAAQLADLKAKQTDRGLVLTLGDVLFDTGKATLKPGAMRTTDQLADFLAKNPNRKVEIEGYTDSTGSESLNQELSLRRASAVRDSLAAKGVGAQRVEVRGLGEAYPVASNDTASGRQLNRRVEVVFSDDSGAFASRRN